jgi:hypothetical protein
MHPKGCQEKSVGEDPPTSVMWCTGCCTEEYEVSESRSAGTRLDAIAIIVPAHGDSPALGSIDGADHRTLNALGLDRRALNARVSYAQRARLVCASPPPEQPAVP